MTACAPHLVVARSAGALDQLSQLVDGLFSLEAHVRAKARQESVQAHTDGGEGGEGKWETWSLRSRKVHASIRVPGVFGRPFLWTRACMPVPADWAVHKNLAARPVCDDWGGVSMGGWLARSQ